MTDLLAGGVNIDCFRSKFSKDIFLSIVLYSLKRDEGMSKRLILGFPKADFYISFRMSCSPAAMQYARARRHRQR